MTADTPVIALEDVSVVFGGKVRALDGVSMHLHRGEIVGLVGESGSGKSTLCRTLMGLGEPTSGTVTVDGEPLGARLARDETALEGENQAVIPTVVAQIFGCGCGWEGEQKGGQ